MTGDRGSYLSALLSVINPSTVSDSELLRFWQNDKAIVKSAGPAQAQAVAVLQTLCRNGSAATAVLSIFSSLPQALQLFRSLQQFANSSLVTVQGDELDSLQDRLTEWMRQ